MLSGRINANIASRLRIDKEEILATDRALTEQEFLYQPMTADAVGTVFGSLTGTSSLITYVESIVGIEMGGATGIASVVCGTLMLLSLAFKDLVTLVPVQSTSGVLVYVLILIIMPKTIKLKSMRINYTKRKPIDAIDGMFIFIMGAIAFVSFSLNLSIAFGLIAYAARNWRKNYILFIAAVPLIFSALLQFGLR